MDTMRINPYHKSQFDNGIINGDEINYSNFEEDGKLHFSGTSRPVKIVAITGAQLLPTHHNPLYFTSLTTLDGITTDGLTTVASNLRRIEILGINGGEHVKGRLKAAYSQGDTTTKSQIIKIKLSTTNAIWDQTSEWKIILDIATGTEITGKFTIFMPSFSMMEYGNYEVYVACDGATYLTSDAMGFSQSLSGSSAATEDFSNDEVAGDNVVIEVASTTGFYVGNHVEISDSESNETSRIKSIDTDTSITVTKLINSYTTAKGAKLDILDFTETAETLPTQRGLMKIKTFKADINSGITFQYAIPHEIDDTEPVEIVIQYVGDETNTGADVSKWRVHWQLYQMFTPIDVSIQHANLSYTDVTPPTTKINTISTLLEIPGVDHAGKHVLAVQIVRVGTDSGDTYSGDIKVVGIAMTYTENKMGYEV